jgi:heme A synthase
VLRRNKKKKKWWQYVLMFAVGVAQVLVGGWLCTVSGGAWAPLGKAFISSGMSDMVNAVTSAIQGVDIDWNQWGLDKVATLSTAVLSIGCSKICEKLNGIK